MPRNDVRIRLGISLSKPTAEQSRANRKPRESRTRRHKIARSPRVGFSDVLLSYKLVTSAAID